MLTMWGICFICFAFTTWYAWCWEMPINQGNKIYKHLNFCHEFLIVKSWIHQEVNPLGENMAVPVKVVLGVFTVYEIVLNTIS